MFVSFNNNFISYKQIRKYIIYSFFVLKINYTLHIYNEKTMVNTNRTVQWCKRDNVKLQRYHFKVLLFYWLWQEPFGLFKPLSIQTNYLPRTNSGLTNSYNVHYPGKQFVPYTHNV